MRASNPGQSVRRLPGVPAERSRQPLRAEAASSAGNKDFVAVEFVAYRRPGMACLQEQDQSRPASIISMPAATRHPPVSRRAVEDDYLERIEPSAARSPKRGS